MGSLAKKKVKASVKKTKKVVKAKEKAGKKFFKDQIKMKGMM